jgi:predicted flap endonuclease-1-like 5' DNA nuclease
MNPEPQDVSKWIQDLITRTTREQIQAIQRLSNLVQRVSSGELDQRQVREEYSQFVTSESSRYVEDLTRLGLSFQAALLELNRKYSDRFFDQVLGSPLHEAAAANNSHARREIELQLMGVRGEEVVKTFVISNKRPEDEVVTFLVSEFIQAGTANAFRPPLQLQPPRLTLRPGEERTVTMRLPLLDELFDSGERYLATIIAKGHQEIAISLLVEVTSPPQKSAPLSKAQKAPEARVKIPAGTSHADDLTQVKGLGPASAEKLRAAGVSSYASLAALNARRLQKILGSSLYKRAVREKWKEQARLVAAGDAAGLKKNTQEITTNHRK